MTTSARRWRRCTSASCSTASSRTCAARSAIGCSTSPPSSHRSGLRRTCTWPSGAQSRARCWPPPTQVRQLAAAVPARYSAMVMVAAIASLRYGEIIALHRRDVDLTAATIQVRQQYQEVRGQGLVLGPPKSRAGRRTLVIPSGARCHAALAPRRVRTGPYGRAPVHRSDRCADPAGNFNKLVGWRDAVASVGVPGLHFHDLRIRATCSRRQSGVLVPIGQWSTITPPRRRRTCTTKNPPTNTATTTTITITQTHQLTAVPPESQPRTGGRGEVASTRIATSPPGTTTVTPNQRSRPRFVRFGGNMCASEPSGQRTGTTHLAQ